ncbi:MAG: hypothetical protein JKY65_02905 [Planctomycetes bacterium]|nr:hypothetical protein [Planctomycetota bacterium]
MTVATRLLYVCNQGANRSREAADQVARVGATRGWAIETRTAGIYSEETPLTPGLMAWGDIVFLFQEDHLALLQERYPRDMFRMRCVLIPIPDVYDYGSDILKDLLEKALKKDWLDFLDDVVAS